MKSSPERLHCALPYPTRAGRNYPAVIGRLCGLGRELDGEAFAENVWRKSLRGLPLEEVHQQLRAFELRFDAKYPPQSVSRSETRGGDGDGASRGEEAMAIVRG